MSQLDVIMHLEDMLRVALDIIHEQAELLHQHDIETEDGKLEAAEQEFLKRIEGWC